MISKSLGNKGLTVVELLVVLATGSIIMATVTAFGINYWSNTAVLQNDQDTLVTRLNTGDFMRNAFNSASGLITQNNLNDNNAHVPDPGDVTGKHWLIIHAIPKTINLPAAGAYSPVVYFNRPSINSSKNIILNGSIPYQDDVIIYLNGSTKQLLERVLANSSATGNRAKTTCPASNATNSCPKDVVIADNVSSIATKYFSRSGNTIDYTSIVDVNTGAYIGPDYPSVEVVEFTLNLTKKAQLNKGSNTSNQTVIRIALRN